MTLKRLNVLWKYKYSLKLNTKYVGYKIKMRIVIARLKNKLQGVQISYQK